MNADELKSKIVQVDIELSQKILEALNCYQYLYHIDEVWTVEPASIMWNVRFLAKAGKWFCYTDQSSSYSDIDTWNKDHMIKRYMSGILRWYQRCALRGQMGTGIQASMQKNLDVENDENLWELY